MERSSALLRYCVRNWSSAVQSRNSPIKLAYTSVMGLALLGFTVTGFWLWYGPRRMRARRRPGRPQPHARVGGRHAFSLGVDDERVDVGRDDRANLEAEHELAGREVPEPCPLGRILNLAHPHRLHLGEIADLDGEARVARQRDLVSLLFPSPTVVMEVGNADYINHASGTGPFMMENYRSGDSITLASMRGDVVLLNMWATWCHPCREEIPALQRLHERLADSGLRVVGVMS